LFVSVSCVVAVCDLDCSVVQLSPLVNQGRSAAQANGLMQSAMKHCAQCRHCRQQQQRPSRQSPGHALSHLNFYLRPPLDKLSQPTLQASPAARFQLLPAVFTASSPLDLQNLDRGPTASAVLGCAGLSALDPLTVNLRI
jgi:hypothetical protein